jgi:site-specific DNA-methyltransferase (adenine-specific)
LRSFPVESFLLPPPHSAPLNSSVPKTPKFIIKHGDCIAGMRELNPASVDVAVTSPPYNLDIKYSKYEDNRTSEDYLSWCADWAAEIKRVLKPDGSFFLNLGASSENPFFAFETASVIGKVFQLQNTIHWIKSISIERESETFSYGHFKPINSPRYVTNCHEFIFHFTPEGKTKIDRLGVGVPYVHKSNIKRWSHTSGKDKRCRGNVWFIPYKTIMSRDKERPHPATFPTELAVKCIRLHGKKNAVALDPFLGIGHAAYAAKECADLVSAFIGFDIDEEYLKIASKELGCKYSALAGAPFLPGLF